MLTVKVMKFGGAEELHTGKSVAFNPVKKQLSISGIDQTVILSEGDVAYVMNSSGKTVSNYRYTPIQ